MRVPPLRVVPSHQLTWKCKKALFMRKVVFLQGSVHTPMLTGRVPFRDMFFGEATWQSLHWRLCQGLAFQPEALPRRLPRLSDYRGLLGRRRKHRRLWGLFFVFFMVARGSVFWGVFFFHGRQSVCFFGVVFHGRQRVFLFVFVSQGSGSPQLVGLDG